MSVRNSIVPPRNDQENVKGYSTAIFKRIHNNTEINTTLVQLIRIYMPLNLNPSRWILPFFREVLPPDNAPRGKAPVGVKPFNCSTLSLSSLQNENQYRLLVAFLVTHDVLQKRIRKEIRLHIRINVFLQIGKDAFELFYSDSILTSGRRRHAPFFRWL